jgi:hypothetical protein
LKKLRTIPTRALEQAQGAFVNYCWGAFDGPHEPDWDEPHLKAVRKKSFEIGDELARRFQRGIIL